jgi:hypothetical protein
MRNTLQSLKTSSLGSQQRNLWLRSHTAPGILELRGDRVRIIQRKVYAYVVSGEVVHISLAEHGIILELTLTERRSVAGDDDELGLSRSEGFQC